MPVGISFIIFQRISYIVDIYRVKIKAEKNFINYATYASLFPHLISGPIIRYSAIKNQLTNRNVNLNYIFEGSKIFVIGFAFKILIADQLFILEQYLTRDLANIDFLGALLIVVYFTLRIYFDFLGYSLMAVGLAKFIGFDFPFNFNAPYQSHSITEFWRRWNITLSMWIRDYIYIPLGGNRKGEVRTYVNLMLVMLLAGLWHGANWNFVIWGGINGAFLCIERIIKNRNISVPVPSYFKRAYLILVVSLSWIIFRFTDISEIQNITKAILNPNITKLSNTEINIFIYTLPSLIFAIIFSFFIKEGYLSKIKPKYSHVLPLILLFLITICFTFLKTKTFFIYNQF